MTLAEFASLAEIIGVVAVVISLVFVALQIRQNTKAVRAASRHENDMNWARLSYDLANDPKMAKVFALIQDSTKTIDDVDEADLVPMQLIFRSTMMTFQAHYFLSKEGSLPEEHWIWERDYARRFIRSPIGSAMYKMELEQRAIRDGFRQEIEGETDFGSLDLGKTGLEKVLSGRREG